jgi:site-specific recombinase XerD
MWQDSIKSTVEKTLASCAIGRRPLVQSVQLQPPAAAPTRQALSEADIKRLVHGARMSENNGLRNSVLVLLMYRYALRVSELLSIKWSDVNTTALSISITRHQADAATVYQLNAVEASLLLRLRRESHQSAVYLFSSERGQPLSLRMTHHLIAQAAELAGFDAAVQPHMLRQARALHLIGAGVDAAAIQSFLGQRSKVSC